MEPSGVSGLQSLSKPSHTSIASSGVSVHWIPPATQLVRPDAQRSSSRPSHGMPAEGSSTPSGVSSEQSLSIRSQTSAAPGLISAPVSGESSQSPPSVVV